MLELPFGVKFKITTNGTFPEKIRQCEEIVKSKLFTFKYNCSIHETEVDAEKVFEALPKNS